MFDLQNATFRVADESNENSGSQTQAQTETVTTTAETTESTIATSQTPEATQTQSESPAQTESTPAIPETQATPAPEINREEIFSSYFKEKTGYESIEEFEAAKQPKFADESVAKLNEWVSKGLKPEDYFRTQSQNFDEMPELDRVANWYALENPELTPAQIKLLVEDEFRLDESEYDERTIELAKIKLARTVKEITPKLKEWQVKAATPPTEAINQEAAQAQAIWEADVDRNLQSFTNLEIPIKEGEKLNFAPQNLKEIEAIMKQPNSLWNKYINANGETNIEKLTQDLVILTNWEAIKTSLVAQSQSKGIESVKDELRNPSMSNDPRTATTKTDAQILGEGLKSLGILR